MTPARRGEAHGRAVLTEKEVRYIRKHCQPGAGVGLRGGTLHNGGERKGHDLPSMSAMAREFGVSVKQIRRVFYGENWRHIKK
jgi:hypothetical protein